MSHEVIVERVTESVDELLSRANLRDQDMISYAQISTQSRRLEWLKSKVIALERLGQRIDYLSSGTPVVEVGYISISHTRDYVAVAFSEDCPCGIDIEHRDRDAARLARKFAHPDEIEIVNELFPHNPALLIWCAKEALYKCLGVAGAEFLNDFRVVAIQDGMIIARAFGREVKLEIKTFDEILMVYCFKK